MAASFRLDGATYERLVADNPAFTLTKLFDGIPGEKPAMSRYHRDPRSDLGIEIASALDPARFRMRFDHARLALPGSGNDYVPDLAVIPNNQPASLRELGPHRDPVPLVVDISSPKAGSHDAAAKLPGYRLRGNQEIWWLFLSDRSLTGWLRGPNTRFDETTLVGGLIELVALRGVRIDLDALFDI